MHLQTMQPHHPAPPANSFRAPTTMWNPDGDTTMSGMDISPSHRLPHIAAFPQALGTGIIITCSKRIPAGLRQRMAGLIEDFEDAFSRFRADSSVGRIATAEHGGTFAFPDGLGAEALFALYDRLFAASCGAVDPLVGEELTKLGYGADMAYRMRVGTESPETVGASSPDMEAATAPANPMGKGTEGTDMVDSDFGKRPAEAGVCGVASVNDLRKRPTWGDAVSHSGNVIITTQVVQLDFGAAGKGMMVDLLANILDRELPGAAYVIDAGGDLRIHGLAQTLKPSAASSATEPLTIAMEDPDDTAQAIGTIAITDGSLCASAPSRRHWQVRSGDALREVHHLLNALDGQPADDVKATWVFVPVPTAAATAPESRFGSVQPPASEASDNDAGMNDSASTQTHEWTATDIARLYPTALADGLATALFVSDAGALAAAFAAPDETPLFQCALIDINRNAAASPSFPGRFFTA
ncbi:FAD:protein FMN transferase [Bifidobacterium sp. SMB2]|uniref:FAD:protein FMN transferase n=1 Tax=Bifidobacterium saimiriisciurei TaxID=2661627 RepID=A0ABX0C9L8_9BIFI|nr:MULTISPECIES: FAD:protein FMN transferase [Bifidobacterium]NEG95430.1 FAD:protein FMN transferase [Bifidobacterium sp. SMB2]NEH11386.1 FAD:protein FMN transferase [Bifidobacterium saimiriisciurei]